MSKEKILELSNECLSCTSKPCINGCPLGNDITEFIKNIKTDNIKESFSILSKTSVLMPICGRICPHSRQCQGSCIKRFKFTPVQIGDIEAFVGDEALKNNWKFPVLSTRTNKKVAIIGGGPAGLTCAQFLDRFGVNVTIFEKHNYLGGLLQHGIPEFRLDKTLVNNWLDKIISKNISVRYNSELGKNIFIKDLISEFDALFIACGANISSKMNIPGENLSGVYGANEFLENKINIDTSNKNAIVSGGGDVAIDTARTLKRLGCNKVTIVYRRSEAEMPADKKELDAAKNEGVEFLLQTNILELQGIEKLEKIKCIKTDLIKKEGETRLSPININGTEFLLNADYVFMAVGSKPDTNIFNGLDIEKYTNGKIKVDSNFKTSIDGIYAGGDIAGQPNTVAWASKSGREAAYSILKYLKIKE